MSSFAVAVRSSLVILAVPCLASAADTTRKVEIKDHGSFEISLPSGWKYSTEPTPDVEAGGDTITLAPPTGEKFLLKATPVWVPETHRDAKEAAGWMRVRLYNQTVEQDIPIEEYKGSRNTVYWFASTNKNPEPGEHEAMVQGVAIVGELMVGFTLLHHTGTLPERLVVLKARGNARHVAAVPAGTPKAQ